MHFSQKLQHIGDKLDMLIIGNIVRNITTALEFHKLSAYWFMDQNMGNIDLHTLDHVHKNEQLLGTC